MAEPRACDLCGLDVGVRPLLLAWGGRQLQFCCEGCLGIYRMLHEGEEETPADSAPQADAIKNTSGS
jgi:hypothetical protein